MEASLSSVVLLPFERIAAITRERFFLLNTSVIVSSCAGFEHKEKEPLCITSLVPFEFGGEFGEFVESAFL
jgi:hypothetical protein